MTERKATITVTGEVSEKDFETFVKAAAKAMALDKLGVLTNVDVSIAKRQTPGSQFDHSYEIVVRVPEPVEDD